jgi:hypothetical protein
MMEAAINRAIDDKPLYDEGTQQSNKAMVKAKAVSTATVTVSLAMAQCYPK